MAGDTRRRLEDLPRSRLDEQRLGVSVVPGSTRSLQLSDWCGLAQDRVSSAIGSFGARLVETRRLELLTLSLQRRCSAN